MILICEECGKKYETHGNLKTDMARFQCRVCSHVIKISKSEKPTDDALVNEDSGFQSVLISDDDNESLGTSKDKDLGKKDPITERFETFNEDALSQVGVTNEALGIGLRTKMMMLFLVVPIFLFVMTGVYYLGQMERFSNTLTNQSTEVVKRLGEIKIIDIARMVASQCEQYLMRHPKLDKEQLMEDPNFFKIATQRVGLTGYATLYSVGPFITWVHPNKKLVGKPLMPLIKKYLGNDYNRFLEIIKDIEKGENIENTGYYQWQDPDGAHREKFMVVTPIEGTDFGIFATVYMNEFVQPIREFERNATRIMMATRNFSLLALGVILVFVTALVYFYAHRITNRIKTLTDLAERISVGEMDAEIKIEARDEIGKLAEAIGRMQNSIRMSIERLRQRM